MREFSAVYSGTNIPVEGMTGLNAGQMLTGVGREVFRRSAFVEQGAVAVSGSPELEKRISAIVSTGGGGLLLHRGRRPAKGVAAQAPL